ncbi:MAG: RHS repeat-associated core domain-containing protein, partial [Burkholderiaceae bacterium]|nr:RHS repeat-associated core domain-containing protein [Burkholderiaceae bacterium]
REYVWLGNTPLAVFTPDPANGTNPPLVYYIHTDHLNTPRVVVNTSGVLRWSWIAEPFGTTAPNTNPAALGAFAFNLRFPGQYADSESGLFYNYFRDYDSSIGRYAQSDPIGLNGGINTYSYVAGNPISYTDHEGLQALPMPPPPIPGIPSPGSPFPRPVDPTEPGGPSTVPGFEWPRLLPDSWVDWIIEKAKGKWSCTASCNVQQINPNVCCPERVTGTAGGPNEPAACVEAKRAATQSTPAGCYPRHCQCRCSKQ